MSDAALERLAADAGIAVHWHDYQGEPQRVGAATLRHLLQALALPADSDEAIADSAARLRAERRGPAPLVTAEAGAEVILPGIAGEAWLHDERGTAHATAVDHRDGIGRLRAPATPGYYRLEARGTTCTLAVAPPHCTPVPHVRGERPWGIGAQLYSLAEPGDMGLASYTMLGPLARRAAAHGAAALAISPTHAMFSADPGRCSPYAPSSRLFLNALHVDPVQAFGADAVGRTLEVLGADAAARHLESHALVDWSTAGSLRLALLRELQHGLLASDAGGRAAFEQFRKAHGEALEAHARFETLHALLGGDGWRQWPAEFHDPDGAAARRLADRHAEDMQFNALLQWLAFRQLEQAHRSAREAGMPIGLIADLAIGADPGGSHAWTRQEETLRGVTIGAPPDLLAPAGQAWGLAAFSPTALVRTGFHAFIELLRASMAIAGGVRIDHVLGLQRLWLLPEGGDSSAGAYLSYPVADLLRLVALESWRHRCLVIGEDLGTVDPALREQLAVRGLLGMSVLYFERDGEHFVPPSHWRRASVAMSSTHDLPTLAGWWDGRDIEVRAAHAAPDPAATAAARTRRDAERHRLWQAIARTADGVEPAGLPERDAFVTAAIAHVGRAASELALVPLEDVLGTTEAPNLPGTVDEHPNWRRRLPSPTAAELDRGLAAQRLAALAKARSEAQ